MSFYWLVVGILAVWRITHLLHAENGPWNLVARLRRKAGSGFWGKLLDCFYCLSLWGSIPFAVYIGNSKSERFLLWLAFSAGASLLERITTRPALAPAEYFEDEKR
jgi:hypothetical protein